MIDTSTVKIPAPEFRGAALELGKRRDMEVCLDGPAGTGKTYACLYKLHVLLTLFPGAKALVARKSNVSLAGSAMATFREMLHPDEGVRYYGGSKIRPAAFQYPNGSELIMTGLDRREKIKSFEFDIAYLNEATELEEEDVDYVRSRMRHGKLPYHQVILDCNPDAPEHWLNMRMNDGKTTRLVSRHEDNPRYFDLNTNDWTPEGYEYIFVVLGGLTGVLLERMRWGLWSAAHGAVYQDSWNRALNVIDPFSIPREWPRYLAVDFGFTNPFVCLWAALDPDGRIFIYRQIYRTKKLVEDHAKDIQIASGWFHLLPNDHPQYQPQPSKFADPLPREVITDHAANERMTLDRHLRMTTTPAHKTILDGIQAMAARLRPVGDGRPRLMIFRDCVVARDPELAKAKQPTSMESEFPVYIWDTRQGRKKGEEPVDANNHALDAGRYLVARFDLRPTEVHYSSRVY